MNYVILLLTLYLTSCVAIVEHNTRVSFPPPKPMNIEIRKLVGGNQSTLAYAEIYPDNICIIYLRKYPQCLAHEVRHCYEGNWHEGRHTDEGC